MSYDNLVIVLAVAACVPFLLALVPRAGLPGPVLEILAGVVLGPAVLDVMRPDAMVQALSIIGLSRPGGHVRTGRGRWLGAESRRAGRDRGSLRR
jgi:hypothetical protein